jgi:hypothetical protein
MSSGIGGNPGGDSKREEDSRDLANDVTLESDLSYVDWVIEKKFYKKFWRTLWITFSGIGILFVVLAWFGISEYRDLVQAVAEVEDTRARIQITYEDYTRRDSLQAIYDENSPYYCYFLSHDDRFMREAIQLEFVKNGFGLPGVDLEARVSDWVYSDHGWRSNAAAGFLQDKANVTDSGTEIAILHNGLPDHIIARVDSLFLALYAGATIEHFNDERLPAPGFVYYID